jgi:hypothetical protein
MNTSRAKAYGRVMRTIDEIGAVKLLPAESELIREAADTLLFCGEELGEPARAAVAGAEALLGHLEESGRWTRPRADELFADIVACGPTVPAELSDAA